jgi:hypothetical protein
MRKAGKSLSGFVWLFLAKGLPTEELQCEIKGFWT